MAVRFIRSTHTLQGLDTGLFNAQTAATMMAQLDMLSNFLGL